MALRECGRVENQQYNLEAVVRPELDIGVEGGAELLAFSDAILGNDVAALDEARTALAQRLGPGAVSAASIIAAEFSMKDRIANGLGIPMETEVLNAVGELIENLGIKNYRSAVNTLKLII